MAARSLAFNASLLIPCAFLASVYACDDENAVPPPKGPITFALQDATDGKSSLEDHPLTDAHWADGGAGSMTDFYSCKTDHDCVAVPKVGCCANGYLEAVTVGQEEAYRASFVCPTPDDRCPHFRINDTRIAECGSGTSTVTPKCGMVAVGDIRCGGGGDNPHECPDGSACVAKGVAGAPGSCKP